jgi:hypothetical protein
MYMRIYQSLQQNVCFLWLAFAQLLPAGFGAILCLTWRLTWPELRKLTDMHDVYKKQLALTDNTEHISGVD